MLYKYDSQKLVYVRTKRKLWAAVILVVFCSFSSFLAGRYTNPKIMEDLERDLVVISIESDSAQNSFSKHKLVEEIKRLNIQFPHIVMAQSIIETGHWSSEVFKHNHNLFGMKEARVRINTAEGTNLNHAYYIDWTESLYDYAFYQSRYLGGIKTEESYFQYLSGSYAESPGYVSSLKKIIEEEELKKLFE